MFIMYTSSKNQEVHCLTDSLSVCQSQFSRIGFNWSWTTNVQTTSYIQPTSTLTDLISKHKMNLSLRSECNPRHKRQGANQKPKKKKKSREIWKTEMETVTLLGVIIFQNKHYCAVVWSIKWNKLNLVGLILMLSDTNSPQEILLVR